MAVPKKFELILKGDNLNHDRVVEEIISRSNSTRRWEDFTPVVVKPENGQPKVVGLIVFKREQGVIRNMNEGNELFPLKGLAYMGFLARRKC